MRLSLRDFVLLELAFVTGWLGFDVLGGRWGWAAFACAVVALAAIALPTRATKERRARAGYPAAANPWIRSVDVLILIPVAAMMAIWFHWLAVAIVFAAAMALGQLAVRRYGARREAPGEPGPEAERLRRVLRYVLLALVAIAVVRIIVT